MTTTPQVVIPAQFYQIINLNSGLSIAPVSPYEDGSALIQDNPGNPVQPQFLWAFVQEGLGRYRVFNYFSGLSIDAGGSYPPFDGEGLIQYHWKPNINNQIWVFNGLIFESTADQNLVWEVKAGSTQPGSAIQLGTKTANNRNQEWRPYAPLAEEIAAAQSATS